MRWPAERTAARSSAPSTATALCGQSLEDLMNKAKPHELVRDVQIETGTACNYRCLYCPVAYHPRSGGLLPLETIATLASDLTTLPALEQIYLNGYDEPTTNPQLAEIF